MKSVLLITNGSGDGRSSSWVVFRKFISSIREKYDSDIHIVRFTDKFEMKPLDLNEHLFFTFFYSGFFLGILNKILPSLTFRIAKYYSKKYSLKVINHIEKYKIDKIWIYCDVLPCLLLIEILKVIDIKFHLTIFDDPFSVNYPRKLKKKLYPIYKDLLHSANSVDTPSFKLLDNYRESNLIYPKTSGIVTFAGIFKKPARLPTINKKLKKICLAGSIFGVDALNHFLLAVESKLRELDIEFHVYSTYPKQYLKYLSVEYPAIYRNVIFQSYLKESNLVEQLQKYDLLYLPLYFGHKNLKQSITSFPSKTHNYLASGLPIIFHVPPKSALYNFVKEYEIGQVINTLDHSEISSFFDLMLNYDYRLEKSMNIISRNNIFSRNQHINNLYSNLFN